MEKNINMQNADDLCLKYVLNELDPSEVLLVEKAMKENDDVLIEIESLRATMRKVNALPMQTPPAEIRQKILNHAAMRCEQKRRAEKNKVIQVACYTAAAILVLSIGVGMFTYSSTTSSEDVSSATISSFSNPSPQLGEVSPAATAPVVLSSESQQRGQQDTQPWVDRNKVLHINVTSGSQGLSIMSPNVPGDAPASRLIPVEQRTGSFNSGMRDLQLTRTQY